MWLCSNKTLWTLKLAFNMICECHNLLIFFRKHLTNVKTTLSPGAIGKQATRAQILAPCSPASTQMAAVMGPICCVLPLPGQFRVACCGSPWEPSQQMIPFSGKESSVYLLRAFGNTRHSVMQNVVPGTPSYKLIMWKLLSCLWLKSSGARSESVNFFFKL